MSQRDSPIKKNQELKKPLDIFDVGFVGNVGTAGGSIEAPVLYLTAGEDTPVLTWNEPTAEGTTIGSYDVRVNGTVTNTGSTALTWTGSQNTSFVEFEVRGKSEVDGEWSNTTVINPNNPNYRWEMQESSQDSQRKVYRSINGGTWQHMSGQSGSAARGFFYNTLIYSYYGSSYKSFENWGLGSGQALSGQSAGSGFYVFLYKSHHSS